jgi:hypothetical protein
LNFRKPAGWANGLKYLKGEMDFVSFSSQCLRILSEFQFKLKEQFFGVTLKTKT